MNWDEKTRPVDEDLTNTASSMKLILSDLKNILDKLDAIMEKQKNG